MKHREPFKFRLYVAGDTQNSIQAKSNLSEICQESLAGQHEIEIVDVFQEPKKALADGILMTPTLVKLSPDPMVKIIGTLSNKATVLQALGLEIHS